MASSLRIEVLLSAIDRATKPFRNITKGASGAAEAVRKSKQALAALEKTSGDITGYARLRAALRGNAATLGELTAKAAANRAELETQRAAHHALAGEVKASRAAFQQHAAQFAALKKPSAAATANYQAQKTALAALEARYSTSAAALRKKRDALTAAEGGVRRFTQRNTELTSKLEAVRGRLEASGYSTDKLASRQRQLRADMQRANQAITQQIQRADALARSQARLQAASGKMTRGGMLASAHGAGFYAAGSVASDRLG